MKARKSDERFIPPSSKSSKVDSSDYQDFEGSQLSNAEIPVQFQQSREELIQKFQELAEQYQCALDEGKELSDEKARLIRDINTIQNKKKRLNDLLDEVHNET